MLLVVDIVIYCSVLACWNNACNCLHVARACVNCCMFCTFCDRWLALLHKERKLLGNSWRWEGGVASQSEMEGLQGRILNYTCTRGRSHGGHFLRPPAFQVACSVTCRWCPCYISFVGHAFQFLIWKKPKSLAALSLCSFLIATQILWKSFWIPSPYEVIVQSYLFIYWVGGGVPTI